MEDDDQPQASAGMAAWQGIGMDIRASCYVSYRSNGK
jgi:hypothetical protein